MEILIGIVLLIVIALIAGKLISSPAPPSLSTDQLINRMQSTKVWIEKYEQLPFKNQQGEGIKKQYDTKKEYLNQLINEFQKRTDETYTDDDKKQEDVVILVTEILNKIIGLPTATAMQTSIEIVRQALSDTPAGSDPYKNTRGNELIKDNEFLQSRLEAGLPKKEILNYWNRPLLLITCERKIIELIQFTNLDVTESEGRDLFEAAKKYKIFTPRFGNPKEWNVNGKQNNGLADKDIVLYIEFSNLVDRWIGNSSNQEIDKLVAKYGTLNAAFSHLLENGEINLSPNEISENKNRMYISKILNYLVSDGRIFSQ